MMAPIPSFHGGLPYAQREHAWEFPPVSGLHEWRCGETRAIGAAVSMLLGVLAQAEDRQRHIMWVADPATTLDAGMLCPDGLAMLGLDPARLIIVTPMHFGEALWAADQAAACGDLAAVVLHVAGNPARLDLTATRRLLLRAQTSGTRVFILRQGGAADATATITRWAVSPAPSAHEKTGIGPPAFHAYLERNRNGQTGAWQMQWDHEKRMFSHVPADKPQETGSADRLDPSALPADGPDRPADMGQIVALERAS